MQRPGDILAESLRRAKKPRDYTAAYRAFYQTADGHAADYMREANIRVDCGSCSFCCYQWVRVLAHEAFAIADFISTSMDEQTRTGLTARLRSYHTDSMGLTDNQKDSSSFRRACPLLVDGKCSIYPVRPSNCRGFHSLDRKKCERSVDEPEQWKHSPMHQGLKRVWEEMIRAADYAYFITGHDQTTYDLVSACLAALSNPSFRRRWADKKKALLTVD